MGFRVIFIIYPALPMHTQTAKTTFSCKDKLTLTKHTWCWTYSPLQYFFKIALLKLICAYLYRKLSCHEPRIKQGIIALSIIIISIYSIYNVYMISIILSGRLNQNGRPAYPTKPQKILRKIL